MIRLLKTNCIFLSIFLFAGKTGLLAQEKLLYTDKQQLFFSAVKGTVSKTGIFYFPVTKKTIRIADIIITGDNAVLFKITSPAIKKLSNTHTGAVELVFNPAADFIGIARATVKIKGLNKPLADLTGLGTKGLEGENEAPLSMITAALGYKINIGWNGLANHMRPELQGDELAVSRFKKSGKEKVEMIPVARFSPDFELPFGYYCTDSMTTALQQVAILSKSNQYPQHQTLLPESKTGNTFFDPGNHTFGLYATGPTHTAYSEDVRNILWSPENAAHSTRIYAVKDKQGRLIKNNYLVCFEEAKNGDYNDYVFVLKNVQPVTGRNEYYTLFNGSNLDEWYSFLKNKGVNSDANNNFRIEDSALHVIGKELGYLRTKKNFTNFHLKTEFKWGEKKWPPRENAKRDAGICYNIPVNEPDSIWPKSIECQVQEGDTGDFWLLGFSTIEVDGLYNKPSAHTQIVKKKDGEKPYGEWNTVEIISYKGRCIHIVNGIIVNAGNNASVKEGGFLLQSEYSEVWYRNVRIKQL